MTYNMLDAVVLAQVPSDIMFMDNYLYEIENEKLNCVTLPYLF